ncbi:MAG: Holliday junction resolvase RuvX [Saprospiraceae bacterium]|nr:Holliday junction resolvase RuvX [Saprospiraceae bacterium]MBK6784414.1 Holliday junction resolvase RuvX [Saprospiraceae bacterium]MBK8080690.1 Holliday junction resolvase RuvX [Saprospiraceae bacterium]MBK8819207.1 Holliday junction resolvase RuvX [Saprospiraceae bacterium]MBK8855773.1 Holliday junction resolvase RuvX [Saprospiraceae bacterium]
MPRILCIDYGLKRCGLAVTDPLQIIVTALTTVATASLFSFLEKYISEEKVEKIVFGHPVHKDGVDTYLVKDILHLEKLCKKKWPHLETDFQNESFTSTQAKQIMLESGMNRKKRQDKSMVDKISAVIILQRYLKHI